MIRTRSRGKSTTSSALLGPAKAARQAAVRPDGPIPIFVISMPRSGSTLLEQMLDQHPTTSRRSGSCLTSARSSVGARDCTRAAGPIRGSGVDPATDNRAEASCLAQDYMHRAGLHLRSDTRYFVDKMPMNWSDVLFIREILPQARFIEIRRNAMDCCFSNYIHHFSRAHASSFDLHNIGRCYVDYVRLMDHLHRDRARLPALDPLRGTDRRSEAGPAPASIISGLEWDESAAALLRVRSCRCARPAPSRCGARSIAPGSAPGSPTSPGSARCAKRSAPSPTPDQ